MSARRPQVGATFAAARRFRHELVPHRRALTGAVLCSIGFSLARLAEPWPLKYIFDNVLVGLPLDTPLPWLDRALQGERTLILVVATTAILALAVIRSILYYFQRVITARVGQEVVSSVRRQLFAHVQRLSLSFHTRSRTGDLLTRLTGDINALRDLLVASLLSLFSESMLLIGVVVVMLLVEWRLALIALLVMPVIFVLVTIYSARIREATRKQRRREGELASRVQEALSGIQIVQMFGRENEEDERLESLNRRSQRSGLRAVRAEARLNRAVELSVAASTAAALWIGATQVIAGRLTIGELIVFVAYMQSFNRPLRRISRVSQRASKATVCLERVTNVLDEESDVLDGLDAAPRFAGEVRFERVGFAYGSGRQVLRDVDLTIRAGETVALVGPTGAGKSTLLALLPRLHDPSSGSVRIDGRDIRELTLQSLREQISVVPQDGMLFSGDFRENIAYGKSGATDEEIEAAARAALIHDVIVAQPDGYASLVGERGVTLSGGERQRIAIARALVKDAPIVLLDEPTTGLDAKSESLVLVALDRLLENRTALIVAHRLATIRRADRIVVMEQGRIVESGTHDALLANGGAYRRLYELQLAGSENGTSASGAGQGLVRRLLAHKDAS